MTNNLSFVKFMIQVWPVLLVVSYASSSLNITDFEAAQVNGSNADGSSAENDTKSGTTFSTSLESTTAGNLSLVTVQASLVLRRNVSTTKCDNDGATTAGDNCPPRVRKQRKKKRQNSGNLKDEAIDYVYYVYDDAPGDAMAEGNHEGTPQNGSLSSQSSSVTPSTPNDAQAPGKDDSGMPLNRRSSDGHLSPKKEDHHVGSSSSEEVPTSLNVLFDFLTPAKGKTAEITLDTDLI